MNPLCNFNYEIFNSIKVNQKTQQQLHPVLTKQMKLFDFYNNPLLLNYFSTIDFIDGDLCNEYLFIIFNHLKNNKKDINLFNKEQLRLLVKNRNINKSFNIQHLLTEDFHLLTPFIQIIYDEDNLIFSGNINNKENYEILTHSLCDYIFRNPELDIKDDILIKAWFIHILYSLYNQIPDKKNHSDLFFLTKLFFEQSFFSIYNESYNMESLNTSPFFFLKDKQKQLCISEYLMLAKEDIYYGHELNNKFAPISNNLVSYFSIIKHYINNSHLKILIEQNIIQSSFSLPMKKSFISNKRI